MLTAPYSRIQQRRKVSIAPSGMPVPIFCWKCSSWVRSPGSISAGSGTGNGLRCHSSRNSAKNVRANRRPHSSAKSPRPSSTPGSGEPKISVNSSWCRSDQLRNSRQAAIIFAVMSPPGAAAAAWMAALMSSVTSVKMSPMTCRMSSSRLPKYRYSAGAVIPISRAIARSETASGPCSTRMRRAVPLISAVVAARTRSRLLSTGWHQTYAVLQLAGANDAAQQKTFKAIKADFTPPVLAAHGVTAQVGGTVPTEVAINGEVTANIAKAEGFSMPVLLILLLLIFGSLVAASLPLAIGGTAILGSFAVLRLLTLFTTVSIYWAGCTPGMASGRTITGRLRPWPRRRDRPRLRTITRPNETVAG